MGPSGNARNRLAAYSRYLTDFEEIEWLGRGAFGDVVKVKNKLDGRYYAIKKVPLDPHDSLNNQRILREVVTISRLHHVYVVRYYQAWIEGGGMPSCLETIATLVT